MPLDQSQLRERFGLASSISADMETDLDGVAANEWRALQIRKMMASDLLLSDYAEETGHEVPDSVLKR